MAMITNIQHFMGEDGEAPDLPIEAKKLLNFLTAIIEAATTVYERPITLSSTGCRQVINGKPCPG
jgi:hypothetical protein